MQYSELEKLAPEAYLNPDNFITENDNPERDKQNYIEGLNLGKEWGIITLNYKGVWSASYPANGNASHLQSYCGIGYHSGTAALLRGFLDSPCILRILRSYESGHKRITLIKNKKIIHQE